MPLDYMVARTFLDREFANIEIQFLEGHYQGIDQPQKIRFDKILKYVSGFSRGFVGVYAW